MFIAKNTTKFSLKNFTNQIHCSHKFESKMQNIQKYKPYSLTRTNVICDCTNVCEYSKKKESLNSNIKNLRIAKINSHTIGMTAGILVFKLTCNPDYSFIINLFPFISSYIGITGYLISKLDRDITLELSKIKELDDQYKFKCNKK